MLSVRPLTLFLSLITFTLLLAGTAAAIPSNSEAVRVLEQPDGSTFSARLIGDEWAHWYETEDGHTVLRDPQDYWMYAELDGDGRLQASDRVVGRDSPGVMPHLRQDAWVLAELWAQKAQTSVLAPTIASITGTKQVVIILVEFSDGPESWGVVGVHRNVVSASWEALTAGVVIGLLRHREGGHPGAG